MKGADNLKARLGGNMRESMGAKRGQGGAIEPPAMPALHGGAQRYEGAARIKDALAIELSRIIPDPDQPRKTFDPQEIADLAASLKKRGQLQACRVRWSEDLGKWMLIVGERRYRAAIEAELETLLCIEVKGELTPDDILEDQLVENLLRVDVPPVEQARGFKKLLDRRGYSHRQLAEMLHIAPASVARALALLELPTDVQDRVEARELAPSVAYEVSQVKDPDQQRELASRVVSEGLTRSEATELVRKAVSNASRPGKSRGASKAKKFTEKTYRTAAGRVVIENKRGLTIEAILAALAEATAAARAETESGAGGRDAA